MTAFRCTILSLLLLLPASAQAQVTTETRPFRTVFHIDRNAPAEQVYADIARKAQQACDRQGLDVYKTAEAERACARDLITRVIKATARRDVASLHALQMAAAN